MCGICGYIGYSCGYVNIITGIKMLLNRGYDGTGICGLNQDERAYFVSHKYATRDEGGSAPGDNISSVDLVDQHKEDFKDSSILQGFNRWRTCGSKSDINTHPHFDFTNCFSIIHNGIIENYGSIKEDLISKGIEFKSETDTEVIVNLISYHYNMTNDVESAMEESFKLLEGTWAVILLTTHEPTKMYCSRHGSPLLIGFGETFMMVSSEQSGFANYVNNYICLNDNDIICLEKRSGKVKYNKKHTYEVRKVTADLGNNTPDPYPHWTIKEINDQYDASLKAINMGSRILNTNNGETKLGGLEQHIDELLEVEHLILIGCGTSYNSGLFTSNIFKEISGFNTVQVYDGANFSIYDIPQKGKTSIILISQSGETKDLFKCVTIAKENDILLIGVINVVDSLIAREVDCGVYLNAGREVAVASTKSFTSQCIVLYMIAVWFAQKRNINKQRRIKIIEDLRRLPVDIQSALELATEKSAKIASALYQVSSLFVLGKDRGEAIGLEGALKIKELTEIHAEGYSCSALKHGPLSLVGPNVPTLMVNTSGQYYLQNQAIRDELTSRDSKVYIITDIKPDNGYEDYILIPSNSTFKELLAIIPIQLLAYEMTLLRGKNPDFPKNLAKIITV